MVAFISPPFSAKIVPRLNHLTPYFDISDTQFEQIVVSIGQRLFGPGLIGFAKGKDGGKDAKFHGVAETYPSTKAPWSGCTIIQAKHTNAINASFSDIDFCNFDKKSGVIFDEIPRIKVLVETGEADNYLLISNRKLSGIMQPKLIDLIVKETGLARDCVAFLGSQQLDDLMHLYPEVKSSLSINPLQSPLIVRPDDLADVIEGIKEAAHLRLETGDRSVPTPRTPLEVKNPLNNMTEDFAAALKKLYFMEVANIRRFLYDPINEHFKASYQEAVDEFQLNIVAKRRDFETFDDVFNYLFDLLVKRSTMLSSNRRLTRAVLYYMYWNCDLGKDENDTTI